MVRPRRGVRAAGSFPRLVVSAAAMAFALSACAGPEAEVEALIETAIANAEPNCIAVMPFTASAGASSDSRLRAEGLAAVRRAVAGHLALKAPRTVDLSRIDFLLAQLGREAIADPVRIGYALDCDTLMFGELLAYGGEGRLTVRARLRLTSARDGRTIWRQVEEAHHSGAAPAPSPVALAMGATEAARGLESEWLLALSDRLARQVAAAVPGRDNVIARDPTLPAPRHERRASAGPTADALLNEIAPLNENARRAKLLKAIEDGGYAPRERQRLYAALLRLSDDNPLFYRDYARFLLQQGDYARALLATEKALTFDQNAHEVLFLKGRILLRANRAAEAEGPLMHAVAMHPDSAAYLNGLGYAYSRTGRPDEALAAYVLSLERQPVNGFAYYNVAATLYQRGELESAREAFYRAGLAYIRSGRFDLAVRAVADLRLIAARGGRGLCQARAARIGSEKALRALPQGSMRPGAP